MTSPKVTITIPTYNSASFIDLCLTSVIGQTYKNIHVNIIDKGSKDDTKKMIQKLGIKDIVTFRGPLLGARYLGIIQSYSKYILILDSDQILSPDAIAKSVALMEKGNVDALVLEEGSYKPTSWVEKLHALDKKLMHKVMDLSPYTGVILARFYRRTTLVKAFENIPKKMLNGLGGQDHAIIFYEAWRLGKRIGIVKDAVYHVEPHSISIVCRRAFRWGYTSVSAHYSKYNRLIHGKERFRTGLFGKGLFIESIASIVLLLMKGIPYKIGFLAGKVKRMLKT